MRQMMLGELLLNPSVPAEDERRLSAQAVRVWQLFVDEQNDFRQVTTNQLRAEAAQYNARLNEIRTWLKDSGLTIDIVAKDLYGGYRYEVREFEGSKYQRLLRKRGLA